MSTDTRIKADTIDNLLSIQPLHLCIGIQFIEVANTQSQIGIGKQLNSLSLRESHKQRINVFLDCTFLQKFCKGVCSFYQSGIFYISSDNNATRIQVIVESFALTQELRTEDDIVAVELLTNTCSEANRNRRLDYHDCFWVVLNHQLDNCFNRRSIKEILLAVIVGRSCNNNKICIAICFLCIQCCS